MLNANSFRLVRVFFCAVVNSEIVEIVEINREHVLNCYEIKTAETVTTIMSNVLLQVLFAGDRMLFCFRRGQKVIHAGARVF